MLKIAVLDDDLIFLKNFEAYLIALLSEIDDYTIQTFNDPDLFIQSNDTYDWLFLDVEIGNHNGLEIAERIKRNISEIIFVSSHSNYVFDSFKISPFSYLLKNELEMKGTTEIQRLIRKYKENQQTISIVTNQSKYKIRLNTILYFFKEDDYILVRCIKNTYKYKENLRNLVLNKDFIYINRYESINMSHIQTVKKDVIVLDDNSVHYISRRKMKYVKDAYFAFLTR